MRNWFSKFSVEELAVRWVHPSVRLDAGECRAHARFISSHLLAGVLPLLVLPLWLAFAKSLSVTALVMTSWLSVPMLLAFFVSRTGHIQWGAVGSLAVSAIFIAVLSIKTGGLASVFLLWFCVLPVESAYFGGSRSVVTGLYAAIAGYVVVAVASLIPGFVVVPQPGVFALNHISVLVVLFYMALLALRIERRRTEAAQSLGAEKRKFELLAENSLDLITRHTKSGDTLFASPAAIEFFGCAAEALEGKGMFERIHLPDRVLFMKTLSDAVSYTDEKTVEFQIKASDGSLKWVEMRARPFVDVGTGEKAVVAVSRDVTLHKQQELILNEARELAEESNEAKRMFLANMSHELRTPLNAIIGFSDILRQDMFGTIESERHREYIELIHDSGSHLLHVVNDILDMSKIEAGKYEIYTEPFDVSAILNSACSMVEPQARKSNITVDCVIPNDIPELVADRRACQQIMINLVSNAIKFTRENGTVTVAAKKRGDCVELSVIDNGVGISSEDLVVLGEPFRQVVNQYNRTQQGTGLGLSVVKGLVSLQDGDFRIESTLGKGTSVFVTLPLRVNKPRPVPTNELEKLVHLELEKGEAKQATPETERRSKQHARKTA